MIDCSPKLRKHDGAIQSPLGEPLRDVTATPIPVVYQDAPAGELSGRALLTALLTSVMISVAVTMVMTPKGE